VYVPLKNGELVALDRESGMTVWRHTLRSEWPPIVRDDTLYLAGESAIHALDSATGEEKWSSPLESMLTAPLAFAGSSLIVVVEPGEAVAFRGDDGQRAWRQPLGAGSTYPAIPGDNGLIYFALKDSRVTALSLNGGARVWERTLSGMLSEPAIGRDRVFIGSTDNFFYALNARSGVLEWKWRSGGDVIGAAVDNAGAVFFASLDNILRAVNRGNGNQRWKKEIPNRPALPPRTFGGTVLLTGVAPELTAFAATDGSAVGSYTAPAELEGPPLIDPVLKPYRVAFVVITRDGRAAGLRPTELMLREPALTPLQRLPGRRLNRESLD
jgi:outer membrane protein assembly factor BamB